MQNSSSNAAVSIRTEAPRIPDHEVLRCIGKGSYGEVWLARSLTGSLRAIKVVRREDFELDRTFEREFEGIKRFEPISRDHPGLVHILHVGRNDEEQFYYYVMELGDDRETGSRVDPSDYEARTMGSDRAVKKRLPVQECVQHGIVLADALAHLHEHGLTHRDIKPSNIIFVNGKPKLADIGLVAAAGQMTFVGTEGFVPPEGPGTAAADIYSLGMVLYELSTGNDRLQFPELPNDLNNSTQRPMWRALNDVICKACAPAVKKRYSSARHMAEALRDAWNAQFGPRRWRRRLLMLPVVSGLIAFAFVTVRHRGAMPWPPGRFRGSDAAFLPLTGSVRLTSKPEGADVIFEGRVAGHTPVTVDKVPAGSASFKLRRNRYEDAFVSVSVSPGKVVHAPDAVLKFYDPPRIGQAWENSLKMPFTPRQTDHISKHAVSADQYRDVVPDVMFFYYVQERDDGDVVIQMVRISPQEALRFCDLLARQDAGAGYLPDGYCYRPEVYQTKTTPDADAEHKDLICFRLVVEKAGRVFVDSEPQGAGIFEDNVRVEVTPCTIPLHRSGELTLVLRKQGYEDTKVTGTVRSGETLPLKATLPRSRMPVPGLPWENSLGMKFQPVEDLLCCAWETRVQDYAEFAKETSRAPGIVDANGDGRSDIGQDGKHPAVNLTRADAMEYCRWFTRRERATGYLPENMEYRLLSDAEWSLVVGIPAGIVRDEKLPDPASRHNRVPFYPWKGDLDEYQYPPPRAENGLPAAANVGDLTALRSKALPNLTPKQVKEIEDSKYDDGAVFTAPAGQYRPSATGLYDVSGNVWEFVADDFGGKDAKLAKFAVTRGASWADPVTNKNNSQIFYTMHRRTVPPNQADSITGFRVVVAPVKPPP